MLKNELILIKFFSRIHMNEIATKIAYEKITSNVEIEENERDFLLRTIAKSKNYSDKFIKYHILNKSDILKLLGYDKSLYYRSLKNKRLLYSYEVLYNNEIIGKMYDLAEKHRMIDEFLDVIQKYNKINQK